MTNERHPLDRAEHFFSRFAHWPNEHVGPTVALWVAHTHAIEAFEQTPRLHLDSRRPGSGKSKVLGGIAATAARAIHAARVSAPAIYTTLGTTEQALPPSTLLIDEFDRIDGESKRALEWITNNGYEVDHPVGLVEQDKDKNRRTVWYATFCPVAYAGLDFAHQSDAQLSRSITIHMEQPKDPSKLERLTRSMRKREGDPIRSGLAQWLKPHVESLAEAEPVFPDGVSMRSAEIWTPLLAIADLAGGTWPERARSACRHFVVDNPPEPPLDLKLLTHIREIWQDYGNLPNMPTNVLMAELIDNDAWPWGSFGGKAISGHTVARMLDGLGVKTGKRMWFNCAAEWGCPQNGHSPQRHQWRGYFRDGEGGLDRAFADYL